METQIRESSKLKRFISLFRKQRLTPNAALQAQSMPTSVGSGQSGSKYPLPSFRHLTGLPREILDQIMSYLDEPDFILIGLTCKSAWQLLVRGQFEAYKPTIEKPHRYSGNKRKREITKVIYKSGFDIGSANRIAVLTALEREYSLDKQVIYCHLCNKLHTWPQSDTLRKSPRSNSLFRRRDLKPEIRKCATIEEKKLYRRSYESKPTSFNDIYLAHRLYKAQAFEQLQAFLESRKHVIRLTLGHLYYDVLWYNFIARTEYKLFHHIAPTPTNTRLDHVLLRRTQLCLYLHDNEWLNMPKGILAADLGRALSEFQICEHILPVRIVPHPSADLPSDLSSDQSPALSQPQSNPAPMWEEAYNTIKLLHTRHFGYTPTFPEDNYVFYKNPSQRQPYHDPLDWKQRDDFHKHLPLSPLNEIRQFITSTPRSGEDSRVLWSCLTCCTDINLSVLRVHKDPTMRTHFVDGVEPYNRHDGYVIALTRWSVMADATTWPKMYDDLVKTRSSSQGLSQGPMAMYEGVNGSRTYWPEWDAELEERRRPPVSEPYEEPPYYDDAGCDD